MSVRPNPAARERLSRMSPTKAPVPAWTAADEMKSKRFLDACKAEGVKPTRRQARAYLARRGRWATFSVPVSVPA